MGESLMIFQVDGDGENVKMNSSLLQNRLEDLREHLLYPLM